MFCQVCQKPVTPSPGVDNRFCCPDHQQHFEQERNRGGLGALLGHLQAENAASRKVAAEQLEVSPAVAAATRMVASLEPSRRAEFPAAAALLIPAPLSRGVRWPAGKVSFTPEGFEPSLRRGTLVVEQVTPAEQPLPSKDAIPELRPPGKLDIGVALEAVEFLGPPPKLPGFLSFPLRYRYLGNPVPTVEPEAVDTAATVAVIEAEPAELEAPETPASLAEVLANMMALLKTKGKPCN